MDEPTGRRGWIKPITTHYYLITYPPPPHCVVLPLSQREKVDARSLLEYCDYIFTAPADCHPETGWTRSEATEGVDKISKYVK